jgi:serine/threonine-protein kinase
MRVMVPADAPDRAPPSASDAVTLDPTTARTLAAVSGDLPPGAASPDEPLPELHVGAARYEVRALLGEGGMGQVHLCHDVLIGRDVARKRMLPDLEHHPDVRARFLREARVQGQLEHPGIVPVHDIGITPEGATYFTMKRVRGLTLAEVIEGLARGDAAITARFSQRKLLSAFVSVCQAIDFAHGRGVLHRDLKPSNIMLGEYGEVSVLDWGLAKPDGDEAGGPRSLPRVSDASLGPLPAGAQSVVGALLGTPGYMPPEYVIGGVISAQGDVFALGAILFEILALEPLYPRLSLAALVAATVRGNDARPSQRAPGQAIAPELDAICVRATGRTPLDRYPTARALSEAVDRFLEGDRDLVRRRELSQQHAEAALATLAEGRPGGAADEEARGQAMRDLGHALALDPDNVDARAALIRVLTEPPSEAPAEVLEAIEATAQQQLRIGSEVGAMGALTWLLCVPLFYWMGMRDWSIAAWVLGPIGVSGALSFYQSRRPVVSTAMQYVTFAAATLSIAATGRVFGPFIILPALAATYAVGVQVHPHVGPRRVVFALCALAMLVPPLLEALGVLPRTVTVREGALVFRTLGTLREGPTLFVLALLGPMMMAGATVFVVRLRDALSGAERRFLLQAWHVQRMMPAGLPTRAPLSPARPAAPGGAAAP